MEIDPTALPVQCLHLFSLQLVQYIPMEQVLIQEDLDTDDKWEIITKEDLEPKARRMHNAEATRSRSC